MTAEKIVTKQVICASDDFSIKLPTIKPAGWGLCVRVNADNGLLKNNFYDHILNLSPATLSSARS